MHGKELEIRTKQNILGEFVWKYQEPKVMDIVEGSSMFDLAIKLLGDKIYPKTWKYVTLRQYLLANYANKCDILDLCSVDEPSKIILHEFILWKCTGNADIIYMSLNNFCAQLFTGDEYIIPIIWQRITIKDYFEADLDTKIIILKYLDDINIQSITAKHLKNRYLEFYKPFIELKITRIFKELILADKIIYNYQEILKISASLQQCKSTKTKINYAQNLLDQAIQQLPRYKNLFEKFFSNI